MRPDLVEQFKGVGLVLKLKTRPIRRGFDNSNDAIFQMDIGREVKGTRRKEWFEIWPGAEDNVVQILDVDSRLNQILLLVYEPEREFEVLEHKSRYPKVIDNRRKTLERRRQKFRETDNHFILINKTPLGKRHFLMGVDERQLFVAQLKQGVASIIEARKQLGSTVQFHEGKRKMSASRQGEWFFIKATEEQEKVIELLLDKKRAFILNKVNIGVHAGRPQGNPHTADELIVIPGDPKIIRDAQRTKYAKNNNLKTPVELNYPIREKEVFIRGCVRHIDHKTIKYKYWYQVILNNEGDTASATQSWID